MELLIQIVTGIISAGIYDYIKRLPDSEREVPSESESSDASDSERDEAA